MSKANLYQHFKDSERVFIDQCLDLVRQVEDYYAPQLTDFLDPRQVTIARSVFGQSGLTYYVSSDYYPLEYSRIILAPTYYELDLADFDLALVAISYQAKFNQLTHSQILGTLLNRLGIKRQLLGDILVAPGQAQVVVSRPLLPLLLTETQKIARVGVRLTELAMSQLMTPQEAKEDRQLLVSSYRLDKLVAGLTKTSRQLAQELIATKKVKVNYQEQLKPDVQVEEGDLISIRGFGRYRVLACTGQTKSGKYKLRIEANEKQTRKH